MLPSQREARSSSEYPKTLASWLELDYFRRPRPLRRVRSLVVKAALLGSAAIVASITLLPGNRQVYQAGPLSTAHAIFNDDCEACHTVKYATASRLARGDDGVRSVRDDACARCHSGEVHHARQSTTPACASCHREHRDRSELARVTDDHCTECHGNLKQHTDLARPRETDRELADVLTFLGGARPHPPFALRKDPGTIRFNHQVHMDPKGLLVPGTLERKALRCADCHQPAADGRLMQPIRYRQDCAACHPLSVPVFEAALEGPAREAADRFRNEPAPHPDPDETAATVRAVLRDRFLEFARRFPNVYASRDRRVESSPIPGRRRSDAASTVRFESEWAEAQLREAERLLFDGAGGCRYCHQEAAGSSNPPRWERSQVPARWMPHSVFNHDSHRSLDCQACHDGAAQSRKTADVLMPTIQSCRECHKGNGQGARNDCVECHSYHGPGTSRGAPRNLAIEDFIRGHDRRAGGRSKPGN